jgi:ubiquinone/menaquinone biosynthesis C-methylase UbiE
LSSIATVQAFWDANPCGSRLSDAKDRARYFADIESQRYAHEPHIPVVARFGDFKDKRVLEIGTGVGTDALQFQRAGADHVGIDLTFAGPKLGKEQFQLSGFQGKFTAGNAEVLPFADESFDHIYSFGVIHHSPSTESIVREMRRVLKPGGTFTVMIYNRTSVNYYVEIMFLRKLFRWMLFPSMMPRLLSKVLGFDRAKLEKHRESLLSKRNITKAEWISMNTDGPECPLAKVYGRGEALRLFSDFHNVSTEVWFFDRTHWPVIGKLLPESLVSLIGRRWGWHRMVYGQKVELI